MIEVGGVCIDKYEASLWDAPTAGNQITGPIPCAIDGQDCDNIWARSVAGVAPATRLTWFQAQAALANSGKRLPTNAEWQMAVMGTADPGSSAGTEDCHLSNNTLGSLEVTGQRENCVSRWGHYDMVGNAAEWVADWDEQADLQCTTWIGDNDQTCLGGSDGMNEPAALVRGGGFDSGPGGQGPFSIVAFYPPYDGIGGSAGLDMQSMGGFRGAR